MNFRTIDALDVMNVIGCIVVSGNVQRSAQIAIGDCTYVEFMEAKRWDLGNIPSYRCYGNNSVACNDIEAILTNGQFWAGYNASGEPYGLINLRLMRSCGRLGDFRYRPGGARRQSVCGIAFSELQELPSQ